MTTRTPGRLGLRPVDHTQPTLKLAHFLRPGLPAPKAAVDWTVCMPDRSWGMLGNDRFGDCFWAGQAHAAMLWSANASGTPVEFTAEQVLADYAAATGFNPADPGSDQGTEPNKGLAWIRQHGLCGHPMLTASAAIDVNDEDLLRLAIDWFGLVGIGIYVPDSAEDQFAAEQPWTVVEGSPVRGAHWIIAGAYNDRFIRAVTWAQEQRMSWGFWRRYRMCSYAFFGPGWLTPRGTSPSGLDTDAMAQHLQSLGR